MAPAIDPGGAFTPPRGQGKGHEEMAEPPDTRGCAQHARECNAEGLPPTAPSLVVKSCYCWCFPGWSYMQLHVSFTCVREWGIEGNSIYSTK